MLCYEDSRISHENRNFKMSLLRLLSLYLVIWDSFWEKFNKQKNVTSKKRIIRIMATAKRRTSCRELFKKFNALPLASEFLLSLRTFVADCVKISNSDIHSLSTRHTYNLHVPNTNLSNIKKECTILKLSYSVNLHIISKVLSHDIKMFIIIIIIINCNWVSTWWQCSVYKYKNTNTR
jgi:hypothetical protein